MSLSPVCTDASYVLRLFLGPDVEEAWRCWEQWLAEGRSVHAPSLLGCELANALYRYYRSGHLTLTAAETVLDAALALPIRVEGDSALHPRALRLAADLSLPATCDAHYLALAEQLDAELWTADARLARQAGGGRFDRPDGPMIRVLGEASS